MPHLLLEGKADRYQQFLTSAAQSNLVDVSDDFHFRIQTIESPTLLLRHVRTFGQATNHGELPDAFFALMLSFHPGGFSSTGPLSDSGPHPPGPTLHWHLANGSCTNHHRNSKVTYVRLESAALLRALSAQAIPVSQLACLQGVAAPAALVQLIKSLGQQLASTEIQQHRPITESFYNQLAQELRHLLGPTRPSDAIAAGHASMAIEWMMTRLNAPTNLPQLAQEVGLTPRRVQACFKSQLALSPMRWLKLARLSALRQLLWDRDLQDQSIQQLLGRSGLGDTNLNHLHYKEVYGASFRAERRHAQTTQRQSPSVTQETVHRQFNNMAEAIRYLETLDAMDSHKNGAGVAITITSSVKQTNDLAQQNDT
ncbi:helix-turn-helix domain-containing protein [Synechococcus sp. BA-132 BA5]|uniref:helix-turn-helix domain-containing protein n=1 Tax=Synechococcus sp. BA-132 BA5 TaxID=3110252 RepID=UPI002B1F142C|nr:helix-turn-helix domain-containing protein [Synechococcus sp. BA-132 BA5]MEA5413646.1 helix-turn-helix domain-containing protein [Synechococcus sp. BA-132 BA5]